MVCPPYLMGEESILLDSQAGGIIRSEEVHDLMHELEDFLRQERDRGAERHTRWGPVGGAGRGRGGAPTRGWRVPQTAQVLRAPWEACTWLGLSSITEVAWNVPGAVAQRVI